MTSGTHDEDKISEEDMEKRGLVSGHGIHIFYNFFSLYFDRWL